MKTLYKITILLSLLLAAGVCFAQAGESEFEKGVGFYEGGEYQKAVEVLQKLVETDGNNQKAWLYLGMSEAKLKNKSSAVKAFKKAFKVKKDESETEATTAGAAQTGTKIISKPRAVYPEAARQNMTQGTVKLAVEFGADGKIKEVYPFQTLPDGLTEICVEAARKIKFQPGTKNGQPYSTITIVTYEFRIY
jgi:outer membrane biosynthesis protein TonB